MNVHEIILHLSLIEGVGPGTIELLIKNKPWDLDLENIYDMRAYDVVRFFGLALGKAELICKGLVDRKLVESELELINKYHINWMTIYHEKYPHLLRNIHMPPSVLYWQGTMPHDHDICMAVIGSRAMNHYGAAAIESFVPVLVQAGLVIVSGGARGADSAAHTMTLQHSGKTIAVLGSGLLRPYPTSHKRLFERMVATGGALISAFPLLMEPMPGNFPARNRIIAGLSRGCLVVQAAQKSGTHITAAYALEQGRELFAIPGPIHDQLSAGCHSLIKQGATLVTHPTDILIQLGLMDEHNKVEKCGSDESEQRSIIAQPETTFKAEGHAATILRNCCKPCSLDELAESTGLTLSELYTQLFELELAGHVAQQANGLWQRC